MFTPRENCFICFEQDDNDLALNNIQDIINDYGKIRTSKTYPPYCTSKLVRYSTNLRSTALVQSIDYNGSEQKIGGDPIQAELKLVGCNEEIDGDIEFQTNAMVLMKLHLIRLLRASTNSLYTYLTGQLRTARSLLKPIVTTTRWPYLARAAKRV